MIFNRVHTQKKQYEPNTGNKHDSPRLKAAIMTSVHSCSSFGGSKSKLFGISELS